jgi:nonsense-mediated mRNA decay protein 3
MMHWSFVMFCVECGKENVFKNGVCIECYLKHNYFTKGPEIIDLYTCSSCSSFKYKNIWYVESFEKALQRHIKNIFHISKELNDVQIETKCDGKDKTVLCTIIFTGLIDDTEIREQHDIKVRIKKTICDVCSKQYGGYYEATLQIRAERRKLTDTELVTIRNTVETMVRNLRDKGNRGLFITDQAEEHGGIDFYLSEKGSAHSIAKKIQDNFGGEIKQSSTNIGMKDSRQIYRMTYLIRLPAYRILDFISYKDSYYQILSCNKKKVHVMNLSNWSDHVFDEKDLHNVQIIGGSELVREMILISQSDKDVQIMDQQHYKTYDVSKPIHVRFNKKTIQTVKFDNYIFLLPEKKHN